MEMLEAVMHSFGDLSKALNRSAVYLHRVQERFELPPLEGDSYSDAYLAFLRTIVFLRAMNISEATLRHLWEVEKKLLQLLHVDTAGSTTWFLDSCGKTTHRERRLLLSNYDLGVPVPSQTLQLGLNFSDALPELFEGKEMGEDALRVLNLYIDLHTSIVCEVQRELPNVRAAVQWATAACQAAAQKR